MIRAVCQNADWTSCHLSSSKRRWLWQKFHIRLITTTHHPYLVPIVEEIRKHPLSGRFIITTKLESIGSHEEQQLVMLWLWQFFIDNTVNNPSFESNCNHKAYAQPYTSKGNPLTVELLCSKFNNCQCRPHFSTNPWSKTQVPAISTAWLVCSQNHGGNSWYNVELKWSNLPSKISFWREIIPLNTMSYTNDETQGSLQPEHWEDHVPTRIEGISLVLVLNTVTGWISMKMIIFIQNTGLSQMAELLLYTFFSVWSK